MKILLPTSLLLCLISMSSAVRASDMRVFNPDMSVLVGREADIPMLQDAGKYELYVSERLRFPNIRLPPLLDARECPGCVWYID